MAVLASAGILYANITPVIVSGLVQSAGYTGETAGYVFSSNMYGTALGGLAITFVITRINWRKTSVVLLTLLIVADALSAFTELPFALYSIRFFHGLVGGVLIGVGYSVITRVRNPEITFAILVFIQLGLGGAGTAVLMPLIASYGTSIIWLSLLGFSVLSLTLLPLLDNYAEPEHQALVDVPVSRAPLLVIVLALGGLFFYQAGQMAAFAYVIEIGTSYLFTPEFISLTVAVALWVGGPAALIVAWWSTRSGRLLPILLGTSITVIAIAMLLLRTPWIFVVANVCFGIFFSLTIPYLLGIASELDDSGQVAAIAGFVGSLGLATGPAIAATILGEGQLTQVIYFAICLLVVSATLIFLPARQLDTRVVRRRSVLDQRRPLLRDSS
jgi:MFS family permease